MKVFAFTFVGLVVIGFSFSIFNNYILNPWKKQKIKENPSIINGCKILSIRSVPKTFDLYTVEFEYTHNLNKYVSKQKIGSEFKKNGSEFLFGKALPVVFEKNNIYNVYLLIKPNDFEYFNINFPDSLQWIKDDVLR